MNMNHHNYYKVEDFDKLLLCSQLPYKRMVIWFEMFHLNNDEDQVNDKDKQ